TQSGYKHSVLVLDEPTVFLPEEDVQHLFDLIRAVVAEGAAVLFISHDLTAVRSITDRVVVLRDGRIVADVPAGDIDEHALVDLIVGVPMRSAQSAPVAEVTSAAGPVDQRGAAAPAGESAGVKVQHLSGGQLEDLSLEIGPGEIVGVAGLIGSGAEDVPYLLFGASTGTSGTMRLWDKTLEVPGLTPQRSVRERVALVPADRQLLGLSEPLTLWENLVMLVEDEHYRRGLFRRDELVSLAAEAIQKFEIRPPRTHAVVGTLSGGNQQKALVAKWLLSRPRLLLLHEPTQGVDVGARRDIYRFVKSAAALDQMAVLWVTTDFGELAEVCSRVIVVSQGRELTSLAGDELSTDAISAAALRQNKEVR
ncbi:MAG: sugar ABC transporter ATP-binding protein, partial [Actinobacteria bacterium]|nr:sugar ABC transporter ATP-binding protein [Actinomycetota bacterium]